jgi:hypothetical protein
MLDDNVVVLELLLSLAVDHLENGVEVLAHCRIRCLQGLNIQVGFARSSASRQLKARGFKPEVELFKVSSESFLSLGHVVAVG